MNIINYTDEAQITISKKELDRITKQFRESERNIGFWEAVTQLHFVLKMNDDRMRFGEKVDDSKQKIWIELTDAILKGNKFDKLNRDLKEKI